MDEEGQTVAGLVDGLLDDQRRCWRGGERVSAETYFDRHPGLLAAAPCALQLLYNEMMLREEIGEPVHLDEYVRRFPQFADQLPLLLDVHQALESGDLFDSTVVETSLVPRLRVGLESAHQPDAPARLLLENGHAASETWPRVAGYQILGELGHGGMGVVYQARQAGLNRVVALKMIVAGGHAAPEQLARFRGEAELLARLEHPNIVKVHEVGAQDGRPYFSLEFVDGGSLAQRLDATPQPPRPAAGFMEKLARAAHAAHQQGIIHRDLKPANILLQKNHATDLDLESAVPKITDFGLAKNLHVDAGQTGSGTILGTPSYMAPEQADGRGQEIGPAADVHALGAVLYELLSGAPPYKGGTQLATMRLLLSEEPLSLSRLNLPADLVTICLKCLQKDPRRRYATALELADDLERFRADRPILARRAGRVEIAWRWARRNPWPAGLTAAVVMLLLLVAVVSTVSSVWLQDALAESEGHRRDADKANANAKAKLWASYVDQAKAIRFSRKPGQRVAGLRAIQEALRLPVPADRSLAELRTEAIACLLLPDIELAREWDGWPLGSRGFAIDEAFERYARGDPDGNISVRQVADDKELHRLPSIGQLEDWSLSFTPDGRFLNVLGHIPRGIHSRIWKLDGALPEVVFEDDGWLLFQPDGRRFVADKNDGVLRLLETATAKELRRFPLGAPIRGVAWNPQFAKLAILNSKKCFVLDLDTGATSAEMPSTVASKMAWRPDGRILARVDGHQIQMWDTTTGRLHMPAFVGHKSDGIQLKFDPSGDQLFSVDWSGILRIWDMRTGTQCLTMPTSNQNFLFGRSGLVAAAFAPPKLRLVRVHSGRELRSLAHHVGAEPSRFRAVAAVTADGRLLAVDVPEGVALIDMARAEELTVLPIPGNYPLRFAEGNMLWTHGNRGLLRWPTQIEAATGAVTVGPPELLGGQTGGENWGASADGQIFAIPVLYGKPFLWQRAANRVIPLGPQEDVRFCAVSPDGRWVATGSHNGRLGAGVKIWDGKTGKHVADLPVAPFCLVGFSPDGRWLATSSGGARLWTVGTWREGPKIGSVDAGGHFTFSPDSKLLAIGGTLGVVRLVTTDTGHEVARLIIAEQTSLWPRCFTADGTQLVAIGSESLALHIFDLRAIRRQLAGLGLDWDQPPYPEPPPGDLPPLRIHDRAR